MIKDWNEGKEDAAKERGRERERQGEWNTCLCRFDMNEEKNWSIALRGMIGRRKRRVE